MFNQISIFISNNSGLVIALILALAGLIGALVSKNKQRVYEIIPGLITSAQALEVANETKFQYVLDIAYSSIPKIFKIFISEQDLARGIQFIFDRLKAFAKEQAKAESIKAITTTIVNNISANGTTAEQMAAAIKSNTSTNWQ